jgi:hypothetical protein
MAKAATQVTTEETATASEPIELPHTWTDEERIRFAAEQRERELFHAAVQAMNGLTAAGSDRGPKGIAQHAFAIADEMLAERERRAAK